MQSDPECDDMPRVSKSRRNSKSPHSATEELYCGPNHKSYSSVGTIHDTRSTLAVSSICSQHSKTMSLQRPFINKSPTNTGIICRVKSMRSSSREDMFDERIIALSRPIDSENLTEKDAHECPTKNRDYSIENESPAQRIYNQRYNKTYPLFESNRLFPTLSRKGTKDDVTQEKYYHIPFPSRKSQCITFNH